MSRRIARFALAVGLAVALGAQPALAATPVRLTGYAPGPPAAGIAPLPFGSFKPQEAALLDYDADDIDDLGVIGVVPGVPASHSLKTYTNGGSGFTNAALYPFSFPALALTSAYLDGNAVPDLAVVTDEGNVRPFWMNADGTIADFTNRPTGANPVDVSAGELDHPYDSYPELLVANSGSWNASLFNNTGAMDGIDSAQSEALGAGAPSVMGIAEIHANSDLWPDVAVLCGPGTNEIRFLGGNGITIPDGFDYTSPWTITLPSAPTRMIVEDLDDDGDDDIAVTMPGVNQVRLLFNQNAPGTPVFTSATLNVTGANDIEPAYIDADWELDLVVHCTDQQVRVLRGVGDGAFFSAGTFPVPFLTGRKPLAIGYVNDDFKPDIALTDTTNNQLFFIQNTSAPSEYRIDGDNRYETAVNVSGASFWDGEPDVVVLATGENFPDALAGAPLASALGGPILLTSKAKLPLVVEDEIKRLAPGKVIILGGTAAVSDAVKTRITGTLKIPVERIYGANRYETAYKIGNRVMAENPTASRAYVCTGENFPDALSASAPAAMEIAPIMLVTKDAVPTATKRLLDESPSIKNTFVVGGSGVISGTVANKFPGKTVLAGTDRYDTSAKVVAWTKDLYDVHTMTVATGTNFPDALGGGAVTRDWSTPLMLVPPKATLGTGTRGVMGWWGPSGVTLRVLGGTTAVPGAVVKALIDAS